MEGKSKEKKASFGLTLGGPSILMIFIVLCFTVFAALSLVSASADYRFTQRTSSAVTSYYEADSRGEELLQKLQRDFISAPPAQAAEKAKKTLENEGVTAIFDAKTNTFAYDIPVDDVRTLRIVLGLSAQGQGTSFVIAQWNVVAQEEELTPEHLPVWGG